MENVTIPTANAMPAPTWHRLHVNDVDIELPANLQATQKVEVSASEPASIAPVAAHQVNNQATPPAAQEEEATTEEYTESAWDEALSRASSSSPRTYLVDGQGAPAATQGREEVEYAGIDEVALSEYQSASLEARYLSPADTFTMGMGPDASEYLEFVAGEPLVFATKPGEHTCAAVRLEGIDNSANAAAIDVIAAPDSQFSLAIALDSPTPGAGVVGTRLRVFADANAQVDITITQTLDDSWVALDDTGALLGENARLNVRHTVLGAGRAYTGLAADLRGDDARLNVTTRYAGQADQLRDFNYAVTQRGRRTRANLEASGVLAGASQKTLRGTIDLMHGCKGSEGSEHETVLLADERVENRTVPVILCSEDDVAGNHGATIGHVRPEQLLYLTSRGIAPEAAERLFMVAAFEQAALEAPDARTREAIMRLAATHNINLDLDQQEMIA